MRRSASLIALLLPLAVGCAHGVVASDAAAPKAPLAARAAVAPADTANRWVALRARLGRMTHVSGDTTLGESRSAWDAWLERGQVRWIEEAMAPANGGESQLTYVFDRGRLRRFEERGARVGLIPTRLNTLADVEVVAVWPAGGGEPAVTQRIEGRPVTPEASIAVQVITRAERLVEMAKAASRK